MAKMLNLDEVASKTSKVLKLGGKKYEMVSMSVREFIDFTREADTQEDKDKADPKTVPEMMEAFVDMVVKSFPSMPVEIVGSLNLDQLKAVVSFARGDDDPEEDSSEKK